jgi:hypothetical protein
LLLGDHRGGGLADRQTSAQPVGLVVVIDQHGATVFVAVQAVQRQAEDVFGPASGVDTELGRDPDLGGLQGGEVGAQRGHDLRRQVPAGLAALGFGGDVATPDSEVAGQPHRGLTGSGQAQGAKPSQDCAHVAADTVAAVAADLVAGFQVGQPIEEALDVAAAQRGGIEPTVRSAAEIPRQQSERVDLAADPGGAATAVPGQLLGRPPLGGLTQPRLPDPEERQGSAVTEDRQIPDVLARRRGRPARDERAGSAR